MILAKALESLEPNAAWSISGGVIDWQDKKISMPSMAKIDAEVARLATIEMINMNNKPILEKMNALDLKRIRPLAEGDTVYLASLNQQILALRKTLK